VQEGGGDVHGRHAGGDGDARRHPGAGQEKRDVQRRLVEEHGVGDLAVLAERLPVIGQHGHHRIRLVPRGPQPLEHPAELRVRVGDLTVVRPPRELRPIGLGRVVGSMGIVEVHPDEERRVRGRRQPAEGRVDHVARGTLGPRPRDRAVLEVLAEGVEALPEAEGGGDGVGAHEGRGAVPAALEERGQGLMFRVEREDDVVADPVHGRVEAGEDRGMRGSGHRHRALRLLEAHAAGGERVQARRPGRGVAVRAHVVRAEGVDGDEEEIGWARAMSRPPSDGEPDRGDHGRREHRPAWALPLRLLLLRARHDGILSGGKDRRKKRTAPGECPGAVYETTRRTRD
jgi:hypothetical protein